MNGYTATVCAISTWVYHGQRWTMALAIPTTTTSVCSALRLPHQTASVISPPPPPGNASDRIHRVILATPGGTLLT